MKLSTTIHVSILKSYQEYDERINISQIQLKSDQVAFFVFISSDLLLLKVAVHSS